ncbi:MAG: SDR family oxidoreductase [Planctomycetota bacterium]
METACAVVGATGGIGRVLCHRLASSGRPLAISARADGPLSDLRSELESKGATVFSRSFDASDASLTEGFLTEAANELGPVTGLANTVGSILVKPAHLTSPDDFDSVLKTNLYTAFACVRAAAKTMRKDGGSIVLFSTAAARTGLPNHEAIAAAKGGVISLATSAAATYASNNIRFNTIAPGLVDTPGAAALVGNETARKASEAMHALGRIGKPDDVASLAAWLLGPEATWVSGQTFGIDGGLGTLRGRVKV